MSLNHPHQPADECDAIGELIPEYAFGLTTPDEARLVESNLAACPEAAAQLADFQRMQEAMRTDVAQIEPPAELEARVMAAIATPVQSEKPVERVGQRSFFPFSVLAKESAGKGQRRISWPWIAAAAAILTLVITNIYWIT